MDKLLATIVKNLTHGTKTEVRGGPMMHEPIKRLCYRYGFKLLVSSMGNKFTYLIERKQVAKAA